MIYFLLSIGLITGAISVRATDDRILAAARLATLMVFLFALFLGPAW